MFLMVLGSQSYSFACIDLGLELSGGCATHTDRLHRIAKTHIVTVLELLMSAASIDGPQVVVRPFVMADSSSADNRSAGACWLSQKGTKIA